ncbi:hypothetical protein Aph01nite_52230 [Acrocarpospora phusangensis]|uniref:Phosphatidylglycerol lysyltransferase C-terminal domain-containing protein n=1 Tax=Acrocarpospora phusangensis TaxID=1070424 RepID=A0A919UQZ2_9ACTN|nr:phosphatidylglycerol lysyltransferase domain-containing protein [Acrocarpospora phusangensis]GIH26913.1 hypothetical protein Aph01nite_52230 [Acrocarpospora phusangensis]
MPGRSRVPRILSIFLTVLAVYSTVIALIPPLRRLLSGLTGFVDSWLFPIAPNLAYAAFTALLAGALARRKRVAWQVVVIVLGISLVLSVAGILVQVSAPRGTVAGGALVLAETVFSLVVVVLLLALMVWSRPEFYARVQPASGRKAALTLAGLLLVVFVIAYPLVTAFDGTMPPHLRTLWTLSHTLGGVIDVPGQGHPPTWVSFLIGLMSASALIISFAVLFRSQRAKAVLADEDEERVRRLMGERDSLAYFATRRDRSVIFSPSGKAAVSYRVVNGVSLAGGDPVGDPEAWDHAIRAWTDQAAAYGWTPAAIGASEDGARAYQRGGLKVLELGDEAVIDVRSFTLSGREMRGVRQAVNRVERAGYTLRIRRHADLSPDEMRAIIDRAEAWRDTETERGFSMALGRLGDPRDGQCVLVEALRADGDEAALLSFVPWGSTCLSLDLMRRDRSAENGLMEFMVAGLVAAAPGLGVDRVSLNFAVFRSAFEEGARIGAGPVIRAWRKLLLFLSRWWQLESLYRANVKYHPEWVPRFLAYGDTRDLVKVGIASAVAEGFLRPPSLPQLLRRGQP